MITSALCLSDTSCETCYSSHILECILEICVFSNFQANVRRAKLLTASPQRLHTYFLDTLEAQEYIGGLLLCNLCFSELKAGID